MNKGGWVILGIISVVVVVGVLFNENPLFSSGGGVSTEVLDEAFRASNLGRDISQDQLERIERLVKSDPRAVSRYAESMALGGASCVEGAAADVIIDGNVDVQDLVEIILQWGCSGGCSADVNDDGVVDVQDITFVILHWGQVSCQCSNGVDDDFDGDCDYDGGDSKSEECSGDVDSGCESFHDDEETFSVPDGFISVCDELANGEDIITLDEVRNYVGFDAYYFQTCDIDLTGIDFEPIGDSSNEFRGIYDGGGYDITGFSFEDPNRDYVGLFGEIAAGAIVRNVNLVNVYVVGNEQVGGLIGKVDLNAALVENSHVSGTVAAYEKVGGLVGELSRGFIRDSSADVEIFAAGAFSKAGGLVGDVSAALDETTGVTIKNSFSSGAVNGVGASGGLVGHMSLHFSDTGTIHDSYSTSNVFGGNGFNVGGLVGLMNNVEIEDSFATGSVIGEGCSSMGGLVGVIIERGAIRKSYATGLVKGKSDVGGLVGRINNVQEGVLVEQSFATGEVRGRFSRTGGLIGQAVAGTEVVDSYSQNVLVGCVLPAGTCDETGGLVGQIEQNVVVENSYSATPFDLHQFSTNFGGFAGQEISNEIYGSFWDLEVSEMEEGCGVGNCEGITGLTTQEMQMENNFEGWDFDSVWEIDEGQSYPHLLWEEG